MTSDGVISALRLPESACLNWRVPKKLLLEYGAPTSTDKRAIADGVEALNWVAALKPTTVGISSYRDDDREYVEIAVLHLVLRGDAKAGRLAELTHRAVPYPVLLIAERGAGLSVTAVHKRWSEVEAGATVLEGEIATADLGGSENDPSWPGFRDALALMRQPQGDLHALYQGGSPGTHRDGPADST
jgi:hypothetical protein